MNNIETIELTDNAAALEKPDRYTSVTVDTAKIFKSWKSSLYSFEWLDADGKIKSLEQLPEAEQVKRQTVEEALSAGAALEKPILGIGMLDNIEIGSGRATFLVLMSKGLKTITAHIPKSNESDFKDFLADI